MTGLAAEGFGKFLLIFLLMNHSAQSMGYLASSFSANPIVGMSIRTCVHACLPFACVVWYVCV